MEYIKRHWRGDFSLVDSFWLNIVVFDLVYYLSFGYILTKAIPTRSLGVVFLLAIMTVLKATWQNVGAWRASDNHFNATGREFWARMTQIVVVLTSLYYLFELYSIIFYLSLVHRW